MPSPAELPRLIEKMNEDISLLIHRISAFDFLMFLCEKSQGTGYENSLNGVIDRLVTDAIGSTIAGELLTPWLQALEELITRVQGLDESFIKDVLDPAILSYGSNAGFGETIMREWPEQITQGRIKNMLWLLGLAPSNSPPKFHAFLTQYKIPKKFTTPGNVHLQSILDPVPES
jgi:hypothetical protein